MWGNPPSATPVFAISPKRKHIKVFKLIRYQCPTFVKHVLAPQDDFGMQKKLGKQTKKVGLGQTPPPSMGKIPT